MPEYENTNKGVLFKNDKKESDKHPDYKGSINVDGRELWLSAWVRNGKNGKLLSLAVTPKEAKGKTMPAAKLSARGVGSRNDDMSDEIPF